MSRDLDCEEKNVGYDAQYPDGGIKCKNYLLCEAVLPDWWHDCKGCYRCTNCDVIFGRDLEIKDNEDECPVCYENHRLIKWSCDHYICVDCTRNICFWDESRYHLNPIDYGCPPCPNGCINPTKGKQCYCEEYDCVKEEWEQHNPDQFEQWNEDEHYSIFNSSDPVYGSGKCPLCRNIEPYLRRS